MPDMTGNAIGFYLQMDDNISPVLDKVQAGYERLTKTLDRFNTRTQKKADRAMRSMQRVARELEKMPRRLRKAFREVEKSIDAPSKGRGRGASRTKNPIADALKDVMRAAFGKVAKFAKGGEVKGGVQGKDSVPALLTPGEVVLPVPLVKYLQGVLGRRGGPLMQSGGQASQGMPGSVSAGDVLGMQKINKGLERLTDLRAEYDSLLSKGTALTKAEMKAIVKLEETMDSLSNKLEGEISSKTMRYRRMAKITGIPFKQLIHDAGITEKAIKTMGIIMDKTADEMQDSSTGILNVFQKISTEAASAINEYGLVLPALAAASLTAAIQQDAAWTKIRMQLRNGEQDFAAVKEAGMSAMTDIGISTDEMNTILGKAAFFKISQKEIKPFTRIAGKATQALEQFGASAEDVTDLMWDMNSVFGGFNKNGAKTERVLETMYATLRRSNIAWDQLKSLITDNVALFDQIDIMGGDAEKAMKDLTLAAGIFGDSWISTESISNVVKAATDPEQWGNLSALLAQGGKDFDKFRAAVTSGNIDMALADILDSVKSIDPSLLAQMGPQIEQMTGGLVSYADILKMRKSDLSGEAFLAQMQAARSAAAESDLLQQAVDRLRGTWTNLVDRLKNSVLPVILDIGGRFLEFGVKILEPVFYMFQALGKIWKELPGPVKTLAAAMLALHASMTIFSALKSAGVFQMLLSGSVGKMITGLATKLGLATKAQWLFNGALMANPIGLVVATIGGLIAALVGFLAYTGKLDDAWQSFTEGFSEWDIGTSLDRLKKSLQDLWISLQVVFGGDGHLKFADAIVKSMKVVGNAIGWVVTGMIELLNVFVKFVSGDYTRMATEAIANTLKGIIKWVDDTPLSRGLTALGATLSRSGVKSLVSIGSDIQSQGVAIGQLLPAMAEGGIVTDATPVVVGEAGPEVIMPLDQLADMLPGGDDHGEEIVALLSGILRAIKGRGNGDLMSGLLSTHRV